MPKPQIKQLIGEDPLFLGNQLFIDLLPISCWFTSIRTSIVKSDWDRLRKYVFKRANYKCQCCSSEENLQGHQRWYYHEENKVQKLMRIIALCKKCHFSTHMGRAQAIGMEQQAKDHMKNVRNWTQQQYQNHKKQAFKLWKQKNKIKWSLDLKFVEENGFTLTKK